MFVNYLTIFLRLCYSYAVKEGKTMKKAEKEAEIKKLQENEVVGGEQSLQVPKTEAESDKKKEWWRILKFVLFSLSAGAIQMVSSLLLKLVLLDYIIPPDSTLVFITQQATSTFIADTVGLALSVIWNFTFNRKFTFKSANNVPIAMLLAFVFYIPFYPFQIWYIATIEKALMGSIGGDFAYIIGLVTCMIINFILEFLWQTFVVFRKSIDTNTNVKKKDKNKKEAN